MLLQVRISPGDLEVFLLKFINAYFLSIYLSVYLPFLSMYLINLSNSFPLSDVCRACLRADRHRVGPQGEDLPQLRRRHRPAVRAAGGAEVGPRAQPHGHHRVDRPGAGGGGVLRDHGGRGRRVHAVQAAAAAPPAARRLDGAGVEAVAARGRGPLPRRAADLQGQGAAAER